MTIVKNIMIGAILNSIIICQALSSKGMLTLSSLTNNDIPDNWSSYESSLNYIPTISMKKKLSDHSLLDLEWSYYFKFDYTGDSLFSNIKKNHRFWLRFSNEKIETRLGLQKIIFGPTQILRPLSWFDTFDVKDPTGQTDGVEAFRLKWFPSNNISLWSWLIKNNSDTLSFGGRTELSLSFGELGFTLHIDPSKSEQLFGAITTPVNNPHNRLAIDYRFDGLIGLWNESVIIKSKKSQIILSTIGADYTIPIASGILVMIEIMSRSNSNLIQNTNQNYSAIMASMPIGIMHNAMYISQFDWSEEKNYHYIRWSTTFDSYSLNLIFSLNPKREKYNILPNLLPKSLLGFGTGIQLMFIYNH